MGDIIRHWIVGNDTPPWVVAAARAAIGAVLIGANAVLQTWEISTDPAVIARAGLSAVVLVLIIRGGFEGWIDQRRNGSNTPSG